jgi:1-acyl-sn-glycerol-3-phosphate acyltransferase
MLFLRSLIFTGLMVITVPLFVIPGILLYPFPYRIRYAFFTSWATMIIWLLKRICGLSYRVQGVEHIPKGAAIIFCKHQSAWETIALQRIFPPQVWVLKRELLWVPFFGWALKMIESVGIDRGSGRKAITEIVTQGTQRLQNGRWVVVFPEGTRVAPGQRKRYGVGGGVLAEKSGFPVVPVAHNAGEFWPRRGLMKKPGVIQVIIGPVIESKGRTAAEITQLAEDWIEAKVGEISTLKADSQPNCVRSMV